ncbi:molybdopterin molybdotransferase MoeA [Mycoplana ramosa]|uniref:Molybdopterin molybdenumtransferase n=1 Tax=Mycoplana ramosa TaxID=40837 RepID=A0ABW3Z227_MYCRA
MQMLNASTTSPLIDATAALETALAQVAQPTAVCEVPIAQALGRVAAQDITAASAMPHFTSSAVDGFALRLAGARPAQRRLPVVATVAAGARDVPSLAPGAAIRIFTGAPLPEGAEAVVPLEDVEEADHEIILQSLPEEGANVRLAGSDQPQGAVLLNRCERIAPHHIGLLAANGVRNVGVFPPPRVAVLSTGDELTTAPLGPGQIYDANRPMLLALARAAGADVLDAGVLPDEQEALAERLAELAGLADLVLTSGGASVGGRDPLRPAFAAAGGTVAAWRVAVKPGKPILLGRIGRAAFTGLPGNPFAAFVGFHLFAAAQIARLSGRTTPPFAAFRGKANFAWKRRPGRQEVFPVRCLGTDETGLPLLERLGNGVSATLFPVSMADGLAVVAADCAEVASGQMVSWQPFSMG